MNSLNQYINNRGKKATCFLAIMLLLVGCLNSITPQLNSINVTVNDVYVHNLQPVRTKVTKNEVVTEAVSYNDYNELLELLISNKDEIKKDSDIRIYQDKAYQYTFYTVSLTEKHEWVKTKIQPIWHTKLDYVKNTIIIITATKENIYREFAFAIVD